MRSLLFGQFCFSEAISCINWSKAVLKKKKKVIVITKQECERDKQRNKQSRINEATFHSCSFFFFFLNIIGDTLKQHELHSAIGTKTIIITKKKGAEGRNSTTISLHLYLIRRKKKKKERFRFFLYMKRKKEKPRWGRSVRISALLHTNVRIDGGVKAKKKKNCAHVFRVT